MPTAEVAVLQILPDGREPIFSYVIPPELTERLRPGSCVWVPFGSNVVQGLVLRIDATAGPGRLRTVSAAVDGDWAVSAQSLELAQWITRRYQGPAAAAYELLLPTGHRLESETIFSVSAEGLRYDLSGLPADERALLYFLRRHGEQTSAEIGRELRGSARRRQTALEALVERGLIQRTERTAAPRVRPRTERTFALNEAAATETGVRSDAQRRLIDWLGRQDTAVTALQLKQAGVAHASALATLIKRGVIVVGTQEREPRGVRSSGPGAGPILQLTAAQQAAFNAVEQALGQAPAERSDGGRFLLIGVTGSGKTEVYLRAAAATLAQGKQVLVLVPEIALAEQIVQRFSARFGARVAVLHSGLGAGARFDAWRRLAGGEPAIAIGSRSAVCASFPTLGLVIVDEEHEPAYKHDSTPRFHARDAAAYLARISRAVLVLGSATPSVETMYAAERGRLTVLRLEQRATDVPLPTVRIIDMRDELRRGNRTIFSQPLQAAVDTALEHGEQILLFLNRRGAAGSLICRDCGYVATCLRCSTAMAVHGREGDGPQRLVCHSCGDQQTAPTVCPACLSPRVQALGIGTERVVAAAEERWPAARVVRWDSDSARSSTEHRRLLALLEQREADIVVGTQMIAKGLDIAGIAVVGVIAADTGLQQPDFRSGERTFQLMTQVAGRAGRQRSGASVYVQSYSPEHYALLAARAHDYDAFYREEIAFRRTMRYPPFSRLVRFVHRSTERERGVRAAAELAERLSAFLVQHGSAAWSIIGPAPAFFERERGQWRQHLLVRMPADVHRDAVRALLAAAALSRDWMTDIDPIHVL